MLRLGFAVLYTALVFGANPVAADIALADALREDDMKKLMFSTEPKAMPEVGLVGLDDAPHTLAEYRGKWVVLNFWATWCAPCVTELPLLDRFHREQNARGWTVVGLAVDSPTPVREFLRQRPLALPVGLAGLEGVEFGRSLGNIQGGLPFTVVLDAAGQVRSRKLGALKPADIAAWAATVS